MSLSVTGSFLTGPFHRPDITDPNNLNLDKTEGITVDDLTLTERMGPSGMPIFRLEKKPTIVQQQTFTLNGPRLNWLNICGFIPGVSTVTGIGRAFVALVHTVAHLAKAIFEKQNRKEHLTEAALGFYNFGRGVIEAVPLLGNFVVITFDLCRLIIQSKAQSIKIKEQFMAQYGLSKK